MPTILEPLEPSRVGLDTVWPRLGAPGVWWSGAERLAIAREARAARGCGVCRERKAALSPGAVSGAHGAGAPLPAAAVDAVHRIASDPGRLSEGWYRGVLEGGLCPEQVIEMTGLVGVVTIADTLARGLGQPERALPAPAAGEPSRVRPRGSRVHAGWVPMVPPESAEGPLQDMYEMLKGQVGFVFNVSRSLTGVPDAARDFMLAFRPNYTIAGAVPDGGLTRPQVELLASSTSSFNDCFY